MKKNNRSNAFILNLTDEESTKLLQLASENDHAPSTQAYIIIRNYLRGVNLKDEHGNTIINCD